MSRKPCAQWELNKSSYFFHGQKQKNAVFQTITAQFQHKKYTCRIICRASFLFSAFVSLSLSPAIPHLALLKHPSFKAYTQGWFPLELSLVTLNGLGISLNSYRVLPTTPASLLHSWHPPALVHTHEPCLTSSVTICSAPDLAHTNSPYDE